jgi:hypothetical protein
MRLLRRTVMVVSLVATAPVLGALGLLAALHTDVGRSLVRERTVDLLAAASGGRVVLGAVETPRPATIVLRDLVVSLGGRSVVRARRVELALGLPLVAPLRLRLRHLHVEGLTAHLVRRDGGFGATPAPGPPGRIGVRVDRVSIPDARLGLSLEDEGPPHRFVVSSLSLDGTLAAGPHGSWLQLTSLDGTPRGVRLQPLGVSGTLRADATGILDADLEIATRGACAGGLPEASRLDVRLHGPLAALLASADLDLAAAGTVSLRAEIDAAAVPPAYRAEIETRDLVPAVLQAGWPNQPVQGRVRARGRGLHHVAHGGFDAPAGRLVWHGRATLGAEPTWSARARGEVRDLRPLAATAGRFPFALAGRAGGPPSRPERGRLSVEIGPGTVAGAPVRTATATARLEGPRLVLERLHVEGDGVSFDGKGAGNLERSTLEAALELAVAGRGRATTTLAFARERRRWTGRVRTLTVSPTGLASWTSEGPAALALGDGVRIDDLRLRAGGQHLLLSLDVDARRALAGTLTVSDLRLTPFCELVGVVCDGVASGRLVVVGTVAAPRLALTASARDLTAGPLKRMTVEADLRHERGRVEGTLTVHGLGGTVVATGSAPALLPGLPAGSDVLDVAITARELALTRLAAWAPSVVRQADGRVRADLHLGGTWAAPRPEGTLTLAAPVLVLAPSGARWEDVQAALRADGRALVLERFTAAGGKGTLTGSGRFEFDAGIIPTADVRLEFDRFRTVDRSILEAACTGTLRVEGPLDAPTIRGRLHVPEGALRPSFLPAANAATEPDPTIEVIGLPETASAPRAAGLGNLTLGLAITLGNGMHIRRRDADIQLGGTLRIERTPPGDLQLRGTVKVERGWYTFSSRRFTVREGTVRFDGGPVDEALVDLVATRRSGEYDVTVAIQGTIGKPILLLSSDPPLDETDVLAVLLVGRPSGELSDDERLGVQAEAASLALGYVVPGLTEGLESSLPLEQVQVSREEVRVGHHIGSDVFISLSQQFVGWAGQTVAVEYDVTRHLSVELSTSSRGSGAIDFFWRRRY